MKISESWFCEKHRASKRERTPCVAATPAKALIEFEETIATETSRLEDAVADCDDEIVTTALEKFGEKLGRALDILKKSLVAQSPPPAEKATRRPRLKPISALECTHQGQRDNTADHNAKGE